MSIKIMSMIWENGPTSQGDLLVLLALADFANDSGECWPSMESIATKARLSDARSARRVIRRLEADGWIETDVGGGRYGCTKYTVKPGPKVPRTESPPDNRCTKPGLSLPETRTVVSPEPSRTIKEPSKSARDILAEVIGAETTEAFLAMRKAIKKPVTEHAARLLCKKVEGHPNPVAVFERSIENSWAGVFPEKTDRANAPFQKLTAPGKTIPRHSEPIQFPFQVVK